MADDNIYALKKVKLIKLSDKEKELTRPFMSEGETKYFSPRETARNFIVKHLGKGVSPYDLFTPEVFNHDVLSQINDKKIKAKFSYGIDANESEEVELFLIGNDDE